MWRYGFLPHSVSSSSDSLSPCAWIMLFWISSSEAPSLLCSGFAFFFLLFLRNNFFDAACCFASAKPLRLHNWASIEKFGPERESSLLCWLDEQLLNADWLISDAYCTKEQSHERSVIDGLWLRNNCIISVGWFQKSPVGRSWVNLLHKSYKEIWKMG